MPQTSITPPYQVLIVESHADTSDMYAEFLRHHGMRVRSVGNATDALAAMSNVDVLVTEIMLPGAMDGTELVARLRRAQRTRNTPIVVVSGCVFPLDRQRARDAGCDVFLPKPCLPDSLLQEVRRQARRSRLPPVRRKFVKSDGSTSRNTNPNMKRPA